MCIHNMGFYEDLTKIVFELSSNTRLSSSTVSFKKRFQGVPTMCGLNKN